MKKKIAIPSAIALLGLIALYFFTPGMMLGDIRHIRADSHISVAVMTHTRFERGGAYVFDSQWQEAVTLDAAQAAELRDLLRGSWYTRRPGRPTVRMYRVSSDVIYYQTFSISVFNDDDTQVHINIGYNGAIWRSNHHGSRLTIRGGWEAALQAILGD